MKKILALLTVLTALFLAGCGGTSKETVRVYNWGEYIDPQILTDFEKEYDCKVIYETYASNEDLYVKLTSSNEAYDVIVPSDYMIERMVKEDLLEELDFDAMPNTKKINPFLNNPPFDPENRFSVPYFWGTLGIIYNKGMVNTPVDSWNILWDPAYQQQIIMYDSQRDSIAVALKHLGYSMNSTNPEELAAAEQALIQQKPLVYAYLGDEGRDVMIQGDAAMSVMYSGDALLMIHDNEDLEYVVPKEGSNRWYDSMVIPKNAQNKELGMKFIDFMCRPEVAAKNAEYCVGYSTPILEAIPLLPEEIKNSPVAYPDLEKLPPLEVYRDPGEMVNEYDGIWTRVRAEQ